VSPSAEPAVTYEQFINALDRKADTLGWLDSEKLSVVLGFMYWLMGEQFNEPRLVLDDTWVFQKFEEYLTIQASLEDLTGDDEIEFSQCCQCLTDIPDSTQPFPYCAGCHSPLCASCSQNNTQACEECRKDPGP